MSFAIWNERPPFEFEPESVEQIYEVGNVWVVTDDPGRATQEEVNAEANALPPKPTAEEKLASLGLTVDELKAALGL